MARYGTFFHKKNPFIRLSLALAGGILLHWYFQPSVLTWIIAGSIAFMLLLLFFLLPLFERFRHSFISGIITTVLISSLGGWLAWQKDTRNKENWLAKVYHPQDGLIVRLEEPLTEKARSYKAIVSVLHSIQNKHLFPCKGKMIIYFTKDTTSTWSNREIGQLAYGSLLLFRKSIQEIRNAGNPGGFDYKRYSLFKGITHQVFLKPNEWQQLPVEKPARIKKWLYSFREIILQVLRKNIPGEKEAGLAEALLIGYKDDLDPSLVQSYSNTGVVHIIAISGLHLGLIYALLIIILKPVKKTRKLDLLRFLIIVSVLWGFSLLAGAQPSVLRSALMFSFIALGGCMDRKTSIYNSIAASAFILLCLNPYWLWDLGFQLSYSAVLSIVIFMRPIYNLVYCGNKLLDLAWKLNAVTLAAQVLTLPLCIYHFHQFPVYFILSNFLAVPLSSAILLGEILLCVISFVPSVAMIVGKFLAVLIRLMNDYIERIEELPGSLWDGMQVSGLQVICLFILIALFYTWLIDKRRSYAIMGLVFLFSFVILRTHSFLRASAQQKLVIYNVPQKKAMDLVDGRRYLFLGDSSLLHDDLAQNFHLKPSRTLHRVKPVEKIPGIAINGDFVQFNNRRILIINKTKVLSGCKERIPVDLVVISGKKRIDIAGLVENFKIKQLVLDASVPIWRSSIWERTCDSLHIPFHDVKEKGAFVMNLR
jgi:competence protein ComEC